MTSETIVPIIWLVHLLACHYFIRHIQHNLTRAILALVPCILLTYIGCHDLPQLSMSSILVCGLYWMMSLRIVHLIIFSPNENRTFYWFIFKLFWILFPIMPHNSKEKSWPIICDFILGFVKLILSHWIVRWLANCEASENYARVMMFALMGITSSHTADIMIGLVRLVTRDKYILLSVSNYPLLSTSLREFWGRRYNRLTSTVFNETIFKPVKNYSSSPIIASITTFTISGLMHIHTILIASNDTQAIVPTFSFFFLHGIVCCVESGLAPRLPPLFGWFVTYAFLFATLPLCMAPYTRLGPAFFGNNLPPLINATWIPKLPVPKFCLD